MNENKMPTMEQLYERAVEIATAAHEGQTRWGGEPYITHPLAVAKNFGMGRAKVVAVLHDVIEDTNITEEDLRGEFPDNNDWQLVIDALLPLTHWEGEAYADYIMRARYNDVSRIVKQADLRHNLSDLYKNRKKHRQRIDKYELAHKLLGMRF